VFFYLGRQNQVFYRQLIGIKAVTGRHLVKAIFRGNNPLKRSKQPECFFRAKRAHNICMFESGSKWF
jgi:hypothetical protein